MVQRLVDKPPGLENYIKDFLDAQETKEQLFKVGREGFVNKGRGVVVVDLRRFSKNNVRFYYLSATNDGDWGDREMEEVCHSYDPEQEVIIFLFHEEFSPKNEVYKLAAEES